MQRKILILAANAKGTTQLRLDEEVREIDAGLQRAKHRDLFVLKHSGAVRPRDIQRAMLDLNPQIVHFSGHGTGDEGLVFDDETGSAKLVDGEALAGLIAPQNSPTEVKEILLIPGSYLTFKVQEGMIQVYYRQPFFGPEGNINDPATHNAKAENGISDIQAPIASLVGVFLGAEQPNKDSAPSTLFFSGEAEQNYFTIPPQLKQVFFIGNGRNNISIQQRVIVPLGAKRLYLGIMDGCSWGDNAGFLDVEVSNH